MRDFSRSYWSCVTYMALTSDKEVLFASLALSTKTSSGRPMMMMMWDKGTRDVKNSTRVIQVLFKFLDDTRVLASNWYPNEYLAPKNQLRSHL